MSAEISIGADPELFLRDSSTGKFLSAHGRIPGTKREPHKVPYGAIQVDGTALEFNIEPAKTRVEFIGNIARVMGRLSKEIHRDGNNHLEVVATPVADFEEKYFVQIPTEALELGCDPDFNAYTEEPNVLPEVAPKFRTGSGHIHIGWTSDAGIYEPGHWRTCLDIVRQLDWFIGIPSLTWDKEGIRRRELYGKAGAFRPKPYGVEYRVLSNTWLRDERLIGYVYDQARAAIAAYEQDKIVFRAYGRLAETLINGNTSDLKGYDTILKSYGIKLPTWM